MSIERSLRAAKRFQEERERERVEIREFVKLHAPAHHDETNWLVSYADMMTLLCGFFIMLFSISKLDQPKYEELKKSVSQQFGGTYENGSEKLAQFVSQVIQEQGIEKQALVRPDAFGVSVIFESAVFFDTLSSNVRPEGQDAMTRLISAVEKLQKNLNQRYRIIVEGHTDDRPIVGGMYPSNWELSAARAAAVVRMFLGRGFDAKKMVAIGYADTHPETTQTRLPSGEWNADALAKNRRVVIRILKPNAEVFPFEDQEKAEPNKETRLPASSVPTHIPIKPAQIRIPPQTNAAH